MGKMIPADTAVPIIRARGIIQSHLGSGAPFILREDERKPDSFTFLVHERHLPWNSLLCQDLPKAVQLHPRTETGGVKLIGALPDIVKSIQCARPLPTNLASKVVPSIQPVSSVA